jgi:hypothetical protein
LLGLRRERLPAKVVIERLARKGRIEPRCACRIAGRAMGLGDCLNFLGRDLVAQRTAQIERLRRGARFANVLPAQCLVRVNFTDRLSMEGVALWLGKLDRRIGQDRIGLLERIRCAALGGAIVVDTLVLVNLIDVIEKRIALQLSVEVIAVILRGLGRICQSRIVDSLVRERVDLVHASRAPGQACPVSWNRLAR